MSKVTIYNSDCLKQLKELESESVDLVITSPPYYNLRDYEKAMQLGQEDTPNQYIMKLLDVFAEVYRVLKPTGSCWVNIDDVYVNQGLLCLPDRFKLGMTTMGFKCRNEIIWHKPNAMPSSAKNRFNNDYEKFYFFVKTDNYYFQTQYENTMQNTKSYISKGGRSKYKSTEQEASVRQGMTKDRGNGFVYLRKDLPSQEEFVEFIRRNTTIDELDKGTDISRTTIEHWFRKDNSGFSYPSVEDWKKVSMYCLYDKDFAIMDTKLSTVTKETDDINKNADLGRIKRAVWNINTKAFGGYHYAPFPEKLVETPILACTKEGDVVMDIFMGSGTVGVVSKRLKRDFIGIEINEEYVKLAQERIDNGYWEEKSEDKKVQSKLF